MENVYRLIVVTLCGWEVKAGIVRSIMWINVWVAGKTV